MTLPTLLVIGRAVCECEPKRDGDRLSVNFWRWVDGLQGSSAGEGKARGATIPSPDCFRPGGQQGGSVRLFALDVADSFTPVSGIAIPAATVQLSFRRKQN